jgi:hypothetical protein
MSPIALIVLGAVLVAAALFNLRRDDRRRPSAAHPACLVEASLLRRQERIVEARDLLRVRARRHRRSAALHYQLACYHSLLGENGQARRHLRLAVRLDRRWFAAALYEPDLRGLRRSARPGYDSMTGHRDRAAA